MTSTIFFIIALVIVSIISGLIGALICAKTIAAEVSLGYFYLGQRVMYEDPSPEAYERMMREALRKDVDVHSLYLEYKQDKAKKNVSQISA